MTGEGFELLYDLEKDISEQKNVIATNTEIAQELMKQLESWERSLELLP